MWTPRQKYKLRIRLAILSLFLIIGYLWIAREHRVHTDNVSWRRGNQCYEVSFDIINPKPYPISAEIEIQLSGRHGKAIQLLGKLTSQIEMIPVGTSSHQILVKGIGDFRAVDTLEWNNPVNLGVNAQVLVLHSQPHQN